MTVVLVLLGGAAGAPLRYLTDLWVQRRTDSVLPWGTLAVNVTGSLLLGVLAGLVENVGAPSWLLVLLGTGFCGSLTTFSTFGYETFRLVDEGSWVEALTNVSLSVVLGLAAVSGGWAAVGVLG